MAYPVPILLIIWRRPNTTKQVINAIKNILPSSIYIACDGPRLGLEDELEKVNLTRSLALNSIDWDCEVKTRFSEINLGCRDGVSSAISWFFEHVNEGIILEDDVLPHPEFFEYCHLCLKKYRADSRIWAISGKQTREEQEISGKHSCAPLHLRYNFSCWGWATWRDRWLDYSPRLDQNWIKLNSQNVKSFCGETFGEEILKKALQGGQKKIDTWDYQVQALAASKLQYTVHPGISLIKNIGFGLDATHTLGQLDSNFFYEGKGEQSREKWLISLKEFFSNSNDLPPFIREVSDLPFIKPSFLRQIKRIFKKLFIQK